MSFGIGATSAANSLQHAQANLLEQANQLSSGKRITSAASDPSGIAIAAALQAQVDSFDQSARNAQDAGNAAAVADGSLSSTANDLQRLSSLAVQASNDFLSPTQRSALQAEATQIVQQINSNAQNTTFNGSQLLNGSFQGTTAATPASSTVTSNAVVASGGELANAVTSAPAATASTISLSVIDGGGGTALVQVNSTDTATGVTTNLGAVLGGSTNTINGTTFTVGNVSTLDVGTTATIQVTGATAGTTGSGASVQTGANQGATTQLTLPNASSGALGLVNIDFSSSASATNAQGQINNALQNLSSAQAQVGAQEVSISESINNNNIASANLQQSESNIADLNVGQAATQFSESQTQAQIALYVLHNANAQSQSLIGSFLK